MTGDRGDPESDNDSNPELRARQFKQAVEQTAHAVYITDTDGTIEYVNPAFEEVTGYSTTEAQGRNPSLLQSGEHSDEWYEDLWETILSGEQWQQEMIDETKHGERIVLQQTISPISGEDGEIQKFVAVAQNITQRKQREEELERYETIIETVGDPVYSLDADGHFSYVNQALVEITGYRAETLIGEHASILMASEDVKRGEALIQELLSTTRDRGTFEMDLITASGQRIPCENHIGLLTLNDGFQATVGILRDISDRRQHERELERQIERLEDFASVVSHDLRNHMNVAQGRLELAAKECENDHLETATGALSRMETIIDDMLSLARAGESVGETEAVELPALINACWRSVQTESAQLSVETDSVIRADETRLRQLFENLLRNSVNHGGADVTIEVGDLPGGFYLEDDGPGIPEDEREKVLETGYTTTDSGGGFGLSIVREIAQAHGWDVGVEKGAGGGARFVFTGIEP